MFVPTDLEILPLLQRWPVLGMVSLNKLVVLRASYPVCKVRQLHYITSHRTSAFGFLVTQRLRMLLTISVRYVYFPILVSYNNKFGTSMLYEQP